jgi:hypothetical protein
MASAHFRPDDGGPTVLGHQCILFRGILINFPLPLILQAVIYYSTEIFQLDVGFGVAGNQGDLYWRIRFLTCKL